MTEPARRDPGSSLSAAGVERRARMRTELLGELARSRTARIRFRRAGATATAAGAVVLALMLALARPPGAPPQVPGVRLVATSSRAFERWAIPTDPGALARAQAATALTTSSTVRIIDDQVLVRTLAEIGRPSGIVRSGELAWPATTVTDPSGGS